MRQQTRTCIAALGIGALMIAAAGCGGSPKTKEASTETASGNTSTSPSGQAAADQKKALVRFVDGIPGGSVSLAVGGNNAFSNVNYGDVTPYQEFPANEKGFALFTGTAGGNAPPVASDDNGLGAGNHYTAIAALSQQGSEKLTVTEDNLTEPKQGKAKVRLINASAEEVNVIAPEKRKGEQSSQGNSFANKAEKLFSGVSPAAAEDYKEIDPLKGTLNIERNSSGGGGLGSSGGSSKGGGQPKAMVHVLQMPVDFESGKEYTIVVTGGTAKYPLKASVVSDQLSPK